MVKRRMPQTETWSEKRWQVALTALEQEALRPCSHQCVAMFWANVAETKSRDRLLAQKTSEKLSSCSKLRKEIRSWSGSSAG